MESLQERKLLTVMHIHSMLAEEKGFSVCTVGVWSSVYS